MLIPGTRSLWQVGMIRVRLGERRGVDRIARNNRELASVAPTCAISPLRRATFLSADAPRRRKGVSATRLSAAVGITSPSCRRIQIEMIEDPSVQPVEFYDAILKSRGRELSRERVILDFGCGSGAATPTNISMLDFAMRSAMTSKTTTICDHLPTSSASASTRCPLARVNIPR
jgi:hypothetical protein